METSILNVMNTGNSGNTTSSFCMGTGVFFPLLFNFAMQSLHILSGKKILGAPTASRYYGELSLSFLIEFGKLIYT